MTARARLPNRRASVTFTFWCNSLLYTATVSYFANRDLAEIFLQNAKAGSHSDAAAKDSAVACSIAPVDVIRKALLRDSRGVASSQLGCPLDMLTADGEAAPRESPEATTDERPVYRLLLKPERVSWGMTRRHGLKLRKVGSTPRSLRRYALVEKLSPAPRYFELFSRSGPRERWDMHGDEVGKLAPRERRGADSSAVEMPNNPDFLRRAGS